MLRNFEVSEHADILEEDGNGDTEDLRTAKIRVIDVFKRQLSLPLLGNDNVLLDFQSWLSTHCTEADTTLIDPMALNDRSVDVCLSVTVVHDVHPSYAFETTPSITKRNKYMRSL